MGKKSDLSEFDRGLVVGARRAGLSVSEAAKLLGYSRTTVSRVFREWSEKRVVSSSRQSCGRKCLVDDRGQRRLDRLIQGDREATVAELTARYNDGQQKTISERTTRRALKRLGYSKTPLGTPAKPPADPEQSSEVAEVTGSTQKDEQTSTDTTQVDQIRQDKGWQI
ncbi:hypothetical protein NL108_012404 [Boleophthalmus pectinirostris]|nr:hypothetical protein NL108_012404 [Boleophthalmus pectinirostris]